MSSGTPANLATLEREINEGTAKQVGELVDAINFPHAHPGQGVDLALDRMGANQIDVFSTVNRANVHKLEGIVTLRDILDSYGVGVLNRV